MKRIGLLLLMIITVVAMTGCSACNDNTKAKPIPPRPEPAPAPEYVEPTPVAPPMPTGEVINFEQPIHFDFDQYNIRPDAAAELQAKAQYMQERSATNVQIQGHCDNRGTEAYNLALGDRRAHSTKKYMMDMGVGSDRMSTVSYGEEMPLDPSDSESAWALNRRAQFIITSE